MTRRLPNEVPVPPDSDLAPWTGHHDWDFSPIATATIPPGYNATCRRCGVWKQGSRNSPTWGRLDCPGFFASEDVS